MMKIDSQRHMVATAGQQAAAFLLPAYENPADRASALATAAALVRQAITSSIRGGRDELALELLDLAQRLEKSSG